MGQKQNQDKNRSGRVRMHASPRAMKRYGAIHRLSRTIEIQNKKSGMQQTNGSMLGRFLVFPLSFGRLMMGSGVGRVSWWFSFFVNKMERRRRLMHDVTLWIELDGIQNKIEKNCKNRKYKSQSNHAIIPDL